MPDNQRRMRFPIPVVKPGEHLPAAMRADGLDLRRFDAPHDFAFPADDQPFEALDAFALQRRGNLPVFMRIQRAHPVSPVFRRAAAPKRRARLVQAHHPAGLIAARARFQIAVFRRRLPGRNQPALVFHQLFQAVRAASAIAFCPWLRQHGRGSQRRRRKRREHLFSHVRFSPSPCSARCAVFSHPHRRPRPSPRRRHAPPRSDDG